MAEKAAESRLGRVRGLAGELAYRAAAVVERARLAWTLPAPVADGHVRASRYVPVRDGTRLAVDLYLPTRRGAPLAGPLPALWTLERYHRARVEGGRLRTCLDRDHWLRLFLRHGYVIAAADVRGGGASFGHRPGFVSDADRWDAYDVTEWLAAQPWSNGRVGMFGKSFMGLAQFLAASTAPPHLAAIFPEKTLFDLYGFAYGGGVGRDDYARAWGENTRALDRAASAAPVDADEGGALRAAAVAEHRANRDMYAFFSDLRFRDSRGAGDRDGDPPYAAQSPARHLEAISASGVAVYQLAGWHDMWPRDALLWHRNLRNPRRLLIGPWPHTWDAGWGLFRERLRFFDHWLKGVPNDEPAQPPIRYYTAGAPRRARWRTAAAWPLPAERPTHFYLAGGGALRGGAPGEDGADDYVLDYAATSGRGTRWRNGYGAPFRYGDMRANDARALTYTTAPLRDDLEVTGHPVACLWVSASAPDVDVFAYLEEVRPGGRSEYVTEGVLRASHRAEAEPPFDNLGLPWHPGGQADRLTLGGRGPVLLRFDLHPLSRVFRRGRRIRLALTGADADNALTPALDPPPVLRTHRGGSHASHVVLPVIPPRAGRGRAP